MCLLLHLSHPGTVWRHTLRMNCHEARISQELLYSTRSVILAGPLLRPLCIWLFAVSQILSQHVINTNSFLDRWARQWSFFRFIKTNRLYWSKFRCCASCDGRLIDESSICCFGMRLQEAVIVNRVLDLNIVWIVQFRWDPAESVAGLLLLVFRDADCSVSCMTSSCSWLPVAELFLILTVLLLKT